MAAAEEAPRAVTAPLRAELVIPARPPFHFVGTVFKPSHFPSSDVAFDGAAHWQTLRLAPGVVGLRMCAAGSSDRPGVEVSVYGPDRLSPDFLALIEGEIRHRFDLDADLREFEKSCGADSLLAPALNRWRGMRVSSCVSLYEFLVIATVLQNATVRRSGQMLEALFRRLGTAISFGGQTLNAFWTAADLDALDDQELRALRLGYRARTLKRQAGSCLAGALDESRLRGQSSSDLKGALLSIYGVGPASLGYLMFEVFKRYDAMDRISPWEQKIYSHLMFDEELVEVETIRAEAERRWGSWRMLAAHYLFEDLFWRHRESEIPWLTSLIRL
jgi:3-methyladenine DNA glycosylase/8-oxoguanine DNA glycosylase